MTEPQKGAVSLSGVSRSYGSVQAARDVSLDVRPGEFLTLLGPSGCGKTTLLRMIAGFETPDAGRVLISGRDLTDAPPYRRPVNTVFQHYALFPHRTVAGNVAFGLETAGRDDVPGRVARALEMVRLTGLGERRIDQLSGGQRQRVALARAVVMEPEVLLLDEPLAALDLKLRKEMQVEVKNLQERLGTTFVFVTHDQDEALVNRPAVLLLDEPLGALDLKLRKQMQVELSRIHRQVGTTFVFVTHDQEEALSMATRIAVMAGGRVRQIGEARVVHAAQRASRRS